MSAISEKGYGKVPLYDRRLANGGSFDVGFVVVYVLTKIKVPYNLLSSTVFQGFL